MPSDSAEGGTQRAVPPNGRSQPTFGEIVRRLRIERGMSQRDLAQEGMSTGYLSRLERGERRPTRRAVTYLAGRLGVLPQTLAGTAADSTAAGGTMKELGRLLALATSADPATRDDISADLDRQLRQEDEASPELLWQALWQTAECHSQAGLYQAELALLERLADLSRLLGESVLTVRALTQLARCQRMLGDFATALATAEQAHHLVLNLPGDKAELVKTLTVLVGVETECGRIPQAIAHCGQLLSLADAVPGHVSARARWAVAMTHVQAGDCEQGSTAMDAALASIDCHDDPALWLRLHLAAISLYLQLEPPPLETAAALLNDAQQLLRFIGSPRHNQEVLLLEARLALAHGDLAAASRLTALLEKQEPLLGYVDQTRLAVIQGQLLIAEERSTQGIRLLEDKAQEVQASGNAVLASSIWRALARALASQASIGSASGETAPRAKPAT